MSGSKDPGQGPAPRDAAYWAKQVSRLKLGEVPDGVAGRNVEGRRVASPIQGFGKMWQKTYRVNLGPVATPQEVIEAWKESFPSFWPEGNRFYAPLTGIAPGEVAVLHLAMPGRLKLSTGVMVLYADDESFTLMTPEGHMFAGWITFSAASEADGSTSAQAQVLIRANDPLYEVGLALGGHRKEDRFWEHTLRSLAAHFGVEGDVQTTVTCVDRRRQWKRAGNIRHNAAVRSALYGMGAPFRAVPRLFRRKARA